MQVWHGVGDVPAGWGRCVVTIGVFDGVHRGHRAIVGRALQVARERGVPAVAITFDPNPADVVRPGSDTPRISTIEHRLAILDELGLDAVLVLHFTEEMSRESAEQFVDEVLVGALHALGVVVGENFRFGHRARGNVALLAQLGPQRGFTAEGVALVRAETPTPDPVSSTAIRQAVAAGDARAAAGMLGRLHRVEGVVVRGDQRGRQLGYPTANLACPPRTAIPADGVYAGWLVRADGDRLPAAVSVGTNPTFDGVDRRVEAYVLDRDDLELYGERVAVEFTERLRPTLRFDGIPSLLAAMAVDVQRCREILLGSARASG